MKTGSGGCHSACLFCINRLVPPFIGRHRRPKTFSIYQDLPWREPTLVERRYRLPVSERIGPPGEIITPLDEEATRAAARELKEAGVTNEEIRGAVDIGQTVKERPAAVIKETADKLTGADPSGNSVTEEHHVAEK